MDLIKRVGNCNGGGIGHYNTNGDSEELVETLSSIAARIDSSRNATLKPTELGYFQGKFNVDFANPMVQIVRGESFKGVAPGRSFKALVDLPIDPEVGKKHAGFYLYFPGEDIIGSFYATLMLKAGDGFVVGRSDNLIKEDLIVAEAGKIIGNSHPLSQIRGFQKIDLFRPEHYFSGIAEVHLSPHVLRAYHLVKQMGLPGDMSTNKERLDFSRNKGALAQELAKQLKADYRGGIL